MRLFAVISLAAAIGSFTGVTTALTLRDALADDSSSCVVERIDADHSRTTCD